MEPTIGAVDERASVANRILSVRFALRGVATLLRDEPNARLHAVATGCVIALGIGLDVPREGWLWLIVALALVWCAEAANTALERLADATAPDHQPLVGEAKDVAAAGVLIAAIAAAAIGLIVLGRPLLALLATAA